MLVVAFQASLATIPNMIRCALVSLLLSLALTAPASAQEQEPAWGQAGARVGFALGALAPQLTYALVTGESSIEAGGDTYLTWFMLSLGLGVATGVATSLWWGDGEMTQGWDPALGAQVAGSVDGVIAGGLVGFALVVSEREKPGDERSPVLSIGAPLAGATLGALAMGQLHRTAHGDRTFGSASGGAWLGAMAGLLTGTGLFLLTDQEYPQILLLGLPVGMVTGALIGSAVGEPWVPPVTVAWSF